MPHNKYKNKIIRFDVQLIKQKSEHVFIPVLFKIVKIFN